MTIVVATLCGLLLAVLCLAFFAPLYVRDGRVVLPKSESDEDRLHREYVDRVIGEDRG